jgi:hypothetical protein
MACLAGCDPAAPPDSAIAQAAMVAPATTTPPTFEPTTSAADAGLAIAVARETVDRAAREQTLRVLKQLREQQREQQQAREAAQRNRNERCITGQKMRRVENGWVQAGTC